MEYKDKGGRPTALTDHLIEHIEAFVQTCPHMTVLAAKCGVSRRTIYNWLGKGDREQYRQDMGREVRERYEPYRRFVRAVEKGLVALYEEQFAAVKSGKYGWMSALVILERVFQEEWGLNARELRNMRKEIEQLKKQAAQVAVTS